MGVLLHRAYLQASPANLATDLARYGTEAEWRGVYYRGEKVGFTVGQIVPIEGGFELQEDGRLQMSLLGATTPAAIRTTARVDQAFVLQSFDFSLDPGTGPLALSGTVDGLTLKVEIRSAGSVRTETRTLEEPPALMLNMARRLASAGLVAGATHQLMVFDPATLANQPVTVRVHDREVVLTSGRPMPAFKVDLGYAGLTTTAWITDTGVIVREESPLGLMSLRESPEQAQQMAVSARVRSDMLQAAAIVPTLRVPVTEPTDVVKMKVEFTGVDLAGLDFTGATQRMTGRVLDVTDPRALVAGPADPARLRFLAPETLIESDDPEIVEQARRIVGGATDARTKAERLVREVNAMLDKKPTVSLPSAKEVLRTKVGDCNEHTALYVALARAAGLPANEVEQLHLAALAAALDDDYECAKARLGDLLHRQPRDVLALQVAHAFDYFTGDAARMHDRVEAVLPAWSDDLPGYHAVLAMHAFSLEECGEYARAEQAARAALDLNPSDARAHHVIAHVFEMTDRPDAGIRWMNAHTASWGVDTAVATHGHWHLALFHLAQREFDGALALYDRRVRRGHSSEVADLIDAAALLWRIELLGGDAGPRWIELANAWAPRIDDAFCSFNDLHAMLAFVGARDWERAQHLEHALTRRQSLPTRHGVTTRQFGLSACRALAAFGRGDDTLAINLLACLPALAHRLGGSHAQRDVLYLTLQRAIERVRRPALRACAACLPVAA